MTATEYHLKLALNRWCGARPEQYSIDSYLRNIWDAHVPNPAAAPYEPFGIQRLGAALFADPFFQICGAAHGITPNEFAKLGDIQTVRTLYIRLLPCESGGGPAMGGESFALFSDSKKFRATSAPSAKRKSGKKDK